MHACVCKTQIHTPAKSFVCSSVLLTCLQGCFLVESPKVQHIKGCPEPLVSNYPFLKVLALGLGAGLGSGALSLCLSISTLSSCSHAVVALLYPFSWQHTFIPVLPASMIDIVCCPTPFLVGLLSSSLPKLKELPVEEVGHLGSQLGAGGGKEKGCWDLLTSGLWSSDSFCPFFWEVYLWLLLCCHLFLGTWESGGLAEGITRPSP